MNNKFLTILMVIFMGYAFITQKKNEIAQIPSMPIKKEDSELLAKIKTYVELFTADPQENSLKSKDQPLISENSQPTKTHNVDINKQEGKKQLFSSMQDKITNIIYNILHTSQGKNLLDRILTTPPEETGKSEPNPYVNNSILNVLEGEGPVAECGDIVSVHYITRLVNGQVIENTRINNLPKTFQIGDRKVIKGIEHAVIGMKKGGLRRLIIPPRLAYTSEEFSKNLVANNEFVTIDIEVIDIKFALEDWRSKINIFQNPNEDKGNYMLCGDDVYFRYKISDTHEKILLKSDNLVHFILGSTEVPAAINKAFTGIKGSAKRMIMLPSSLLYNKKVSFFPKGVKLPKKEMLIFEIDTGFYNDK